jgi:hypothetical protein
MNTVQKLIEDVSTARTLFLNKISNVTEIKAQWKPDPETWNIIENTEHLFWAEQGAIVGMWRTLHAIREGKMERNYESVHKNMPIAQDNRINMEAKGESSTNCRTTDGWAFVILENITT